MAAFFISVCAALYTFVTLKKSFLLLIIFLPLLAFGQVQRWTGEWVGTIDFNGTPVDVRFIVKPRYDGLVTTMDVPMQRLKKYRMSSTESDAHSLHIVSEDLDIDCILKHKDSSTLKGTMVQKGKTFDLLLKHNFGQWPVPKPQTPKPPYPYASTDIKISVAKGHVMVYGTVTTPDTSKTHPAIILISGSGPQDRDGSIGNHHMFHILADTFTKMGFVVLRCDDRGAGYTTGNPSVLRRTTTADQADDVVEFMNFLKTLPYVDTAQIGLLGHSEGGMIAPMVAASGAHVAFMMILAGPGQTGREISNFQNELALKNAGMKKRQLNSYMKLHNLLVDGILKSADTTAFKTAFDSALLIWKHNGSTALLRRHILHSAKGKRQLYQQYSGLLVPWWKYFISYNPVPALQKLNMPVLALNGSKDNQVIPHPNLDIIRDSVSASEKPKVTIVELPGLNHLFQTCKSCDLKEYFTLEETIAPAALNAMVNWLYTTILPGK